MVRANLRVLIPAAKIAVRVRELGAQIDADYDGHIHLVGILKGALMFHADLARSITRPVRLDFIGISSYGKGKTSSGEVRFTRDLDTSIEGIDVLIVEDIVDSGVTLSYLTQVLQQRKPKSLNIVTLLDHSALDANSDEKQFLVMPIAAGGNLAQRVGMFTLDDLEWIAEFLGVEYNLV